jgi:sortase B
MYKLYKIYTDVKENISITKSIKETLGEAIDISKLKEMNADTVGYLVVNNTDIDYVVVKAKDNDYYLKHNFNKKYSSAGWVFADYRDNFDGNDKNIIIYGHNMLNGSMFGTLKKILTKEWYTNKENYIIKFITEEGTNYYEVFSVYNIKKEDYYIRTDFKNNTAYKNFIRTIKKRSIYKFNVDTDNTDQILTLSTCSNNGKNRVVLHAKRISQ